MDIVTRLRAEREVLVERLAQIDKMLREYDEWGREAQRLLSLTAASGGVANNEAIDQGAEADSKSGGIAIEAHRRLENIDRVRRVRLGPSNKTPIRDFEAAVIDVLKESGKPMDRTELYDALTERGIVIGSGNRDKDLNALSARVYRMAQNPEHGITGERGQGYRLMGDDEVDTSAPTGQPEASATGDDDLI